MEIITHLTSHVNVTNTARNSRTVAMTTAKHVRRRKLIKRKIPVSSLY